MSDTSPRIDLSAIWNRLEPKEPVPFRSGMVIPSENPTESGQPFAPRALVCEIKVYYPSPRRHHAEDHFGE